MTGPEPRRFTFHPDYCCREGAQKLCIKIESYWIENGHPNVKCRVETNPVPQNSFNGAVYGVRSNLIGGLPPAPVRLGRRTPLI